MDDKTLRVILYVCTAILIMLIALLFITHPRPKEAMYGQYEESLDDAGNGVCQRKTK